MYVAYIKKENAGVTTMRNKRDGRVPPHPIFGFSFLSNPIILGNGMKKGKHTQI